MSHEGSHDATSLESVRKSRRVGTSSLVVGVVDVDVPVAAPTPLFTPLPAVSLALFTPPVAAPSPFCAVFVAVFVVF